MKGKTICNMCGKEFDMFDECHNYGIHDEFDLSSKHRGYVVELDLCCKCFDKTVDLIASKCKHNPIESSTDFIFS